MEYKNTDNDIKIIIEQNNNKLELTTRFDSDLDDWVHTFKTILTWLTFHPDSIDCIFAKEE